MRRKNPSNGTIQLALRVPGSGNTTLNFVPIDYVVNGMVEIGGRDSSIGNTYHLANPEATPNRIWLPAVCRLLGMEGLRFVDPQSFVNEPPNRLEALFRKHMTFYYMYLQGEPRFDCSRALEALKGTGIECPPVTEAFTNKMIGWYIDSPQTEKGVCVNHLSLHGTSNSNRHLSPQQQQFESVRAIEGFDFQA
jgi:hypothetical protein